MLQHRYAPLLFISPFVLLFCCFMLYPLGRSIVLSLHKSSGARHMRFIGLENYSFLVRDDLFWLAVANTIYFAIAFLLLQIPMSLGLALLLNRSRTRFRNFFRFAFFSSHLCGHVFVAVIFSLLLAERNGLVNRGIAMILPWVGSEIRWLGKPVLAMPALIIAALWLSVGYAMIYFLAALQSVDRELYEAAEVDGAGKWSQFWNVTLPGIRPVLIFMILVGTIGALQLFELPYVLFNGSGPGNSAMTIVMYLFNTGFDAGDIGYASAIGWMLALMIAVVAFIQLKVTRATAEDR
jgi:ABC-type sugar transport system permease subunit